MEREEKVQFIVEQMRLCVANRDFIRAQIVSKKLSTKFFFSKSDIVQVSSAQSMIIAMNLWFYISRILSYDIID